MIVLDLYRTLSLHFLLAMRLLQLAEVDHLVARIYAVILLSLDLLRR